MGRGRPARRKEEDAGEKHRRGAKHLAESTPTTAASADLAVAVEEPVARRSAVALVREEELEHREDEACPQIETSLDEVHLLP
jgi:hypothetical protein